MDNDYPINLEDGETTRKGIILLNVMSDVEVKANGITCPSCGEGEVEKLLVCEARAYESVMRKRGTYMEDGIKLLQILCLSCNNRVLVERVKNKVMNWWKESKGKLITF